MRSQPETRGSPPGRGPLPQRGPARRESRPRIRGLRPGTRQALARMVTDVRYELLPLAGADEQADALPPEATVPVTCSPRHGIDATVALAARLATRGHVAVPHLAARRVRDEVHLKDLLDRLDRAGVTEAFVVGGDGSADGDYADGLGLLEGLRNVGHPLRRIGVPAYPEGHHLIDDDVLWRDLAAKADHADYVVTQLCFDARAVCGWVAEARRRGIELPVYAGVPGVVDPATLLKISHRVGIGDSVRFLRSHTGALRRLAQPGGYRPDGLLRRLAAQVRDGTCDVAGLHLYTFNRVGPTVRRVQALQRHVAANDERGELS